MAEVKKTYEYSAKNGSFSIWLGGKHCVSKNSVLTLTEEQHNELQELIASGRHDISVELTYLDKEAAEAVAKKFIASQRPAALQGKTHSQAAAEKSPDVRTGNQEVGGAKASPLQDRLKANRESLLATRTPEPPETPRNLDVVEENAVHANEIAPPSS